VKFNKLSRRDFLKAAGATSGIVLLGDPIRGLRAFAQGATQADLSVYREAGIDWSRFAGERLTVLVTPAHYFTKFRAITPQFTELTGIEIDFDVIPPAEMRDKAVLDFTARTRLYATHTADPMYLPLYVANGWIDPIEEYHGDDRLTDQEWFDMDDIIPLWRAADSVNGQLYALPSEGEVTVHIYRKDLYEQLGIAAPDTLDELRQTATALHGHQPNLSGLALRGFRGAGQNMYIWPSLFRSYGGEWFDANDRPMVNSDAGIDSLRYYVDVMNSFAPAGVENWNWPEIMEAFAGGSVAQYIDSNSTASVIEDPNKSRVAGKIGYQRWPKGPSGKRVSSIWNWAMPINAHLPERQKQATWLYLQWLASRPTQLRSAIYKESEDAVVRTGVNRLSLWESPEYREVVGFTPDYADVVLTSLSEDTDADWRPRRPEWPQIGTAMAIAIQSALVGQATPEQALNTANDEISRIVG
jgi:multiple sugar transport system substrate-binding protein